VAAGNKDGDLRGEWPLVGHLNYSKRCRLQRQYDGVEVYSRWSWNVETLINIQTRLDVM